MHSVFATIATLVTSSLAWTYYVMIGSWRDNNLANYREDHCQEEQGNGTVHLSMTIMSVKIIVIEFPIVTAIMIIMLSTTMTTKRLWENIHGNTEGNNNNITWYFVSRLTLILFMLWRTKKSPGTDRVTMIRPVIERQNVAMIKVSQMMIWFIINIPYIAVKPAIAW